MVQKLFELSSHAVRNSVVDGKIFNVSHLLLNLRRWIFELFRMKQLLNNRNVILVLEQPGFFDGFTTISMEEGDASTCISSEADANGTSDGCFLACLASIFSANSHLAGNITELNLCFAALCSYDSRQDAPCPLMQYIFKILASCGNLKRLLLVAYKENSVQVHGFGTNNCFHKFLENTEVVLPALEHLALRNRTEYCWHLKEVPKRWFESIQSLELTRVSSDCDTYLEILSICRNTLDSLSLAYVGEHEFEFINTLLPLTLPKLNSLSLVSACSRPIIFEQIEEHCPTLTKARVDMPIDEISIMQLYALRRIRNLLELHVVIQKSTYHFYDFVDAAGESIYGLTIFVSLAGSKYRRILLRCANLSTLKIYNSVGAFGFGMYEFNTDLEIFLLRLFNDTDRATKLTELDIMGALSEPVLDSLFMNCCNLTNLAIHWNDQTREVYRYLRMWIKNGGRPSLLTLNGYSDAHLETISSLVIASKHNLKNLTIKVRHVDEKRIEMFLNVLANSCPFIECCKIEYLAAFELDRMTPLLEKYEQICFRKNPLYIKLLNYRH